MALVASNNVWQISLRYIEKYTSSGDSRYYPKQTAINIKRLMQVLLVNILQWKAFVTDVRVHFIRDQVMKGTLDVDYVETSSNDADMLTKPLGPLQLGEAIIRIGMETET